MTTNRNILLLLGVLAIASAFVFRGYLQDELVAPAPGLEVQTIRSDIDLMLSSSNPDFPSRKLGTWQIEYPPEINENSEGILKAKYVIPAADHPDSRLWWEVESGVLLSLRVDSNSLDISEPKTFVFNDSINPDSESIVPHPWVITPKSEGQFFIMLDFSSTIEDSVFPVELDATINNEPAALENGAMLTLPIKVTTIFGISQRTFELIRYAFIILGFVLTLPLLKGRFGRIFGR